MRMLEHDEEKDDAAEVTWEDQQRINTFSKLNARIKLIEQKLDTLKQEKEALDDLSPELELAEEDELVLYRVGDTFVHLPQPRALKRLEQDQEKISKQVEELSSQADNCEIQMKELKVQLYAKFGKAINLDE
ncbi:Prefoldin, subunit 4 [Coprinopsis marcescibilis]|uniref:Prefoldin subunit 4 n=1 Tax=Coprinopsis marcescibilis TaxID=230819 RepID=A0A5C3KSU8_COPMA|nr:Prefoldin, subunit 4 [Coprinopsis marcescibilis]